MTDDAPANEDKPGKTLRTLYIASLAFLLAIVGVWIYALLSPMRTRIVYDQLGMTERNFFSQALEAVAPVINVIFAATPFVVVLLLIAGWPVLKRGSRRTMKRLLVANWTLVVFIVAFNWLPYLELQRKLGSGN